MKKCSNSIIHCNECENAEKCIKCEKDFYFINNETKKCYNINEILSINEYYLDENNLSYYSCNDTKFNSIENCKECNKKDSCYLCKEKYTFINGNKSKCYEISELGEKYIIDSNDKSNYIKCSDYINKCSLCNNSICFNCDEGYIFINDDFNNCLLKSSIDLSNYYSNDGKTYYSCENEKYKSNYECLKISQINILVKSETIKTNSTTLITYPKPLKINPAIIESQIIKTTINTNFKTTILKNQTEYHESHINKITIILLQVKLKDHQLYLYILIDSYIPKDFSLKLKINIYTQKSLRNLQQEEKKEMEIDISPLNYTDSNSFGGLYTFSPSQSFKEYLISEGEKIRIEVTNLISNNSENEYNIEMGDNPDYLDTAKMEEKLNNSQKVDLGLINNIHIYHLESISYGCIFELTTNETLKVSDRKINLQFKENNSYKNRSTICSLIKNNNKIKCNFDENINSNYILKNYIEVNNNELFSIISNEQNIFTMICPNRSNKKSSSSSKTSIVIIIIVSIVITIIFMSLIYILYKKYNKNNGINPSLNKIDISNSSKTQILN